MPTVGFLSTLNEADFSYLLTAFAERLGAVLKPSLSILGSGHDVPANFDDTSHVFICTRWTNGDYDNLAVAVGELVAIQPEPAVIAATGGATTAVAAQNAAPNRIPIIFLSGRKKDEDRDGHRNSARGIWLDSTLRSVERTERHRRFRSFFNFNNDKIFNLIHRKSRVNDDEKDWTNPVTVEDGPRNDFTDAFDRLETLKRNDDIQGLTVAADSYFTMRMADIVTFANSDRFGRPVSYPFREYVKMGGLMSSGPDLAEAYGALGSWAAAIINNPGRDLGRLPDKTLGRQRLVVNRATAIAQLPAAKAQELLEIADDVI